MIELKNITKIFGEFKAVDDLSLNINTWECFWLLWKNWAGKTTTIKMIVGLLEQTQWEILFDWKSIHRETLEVKNHLSYIPDTPYVYDKLTGMEFLFFVWTVYWMEKSEIKKRAEKFIKLFNIEEIINKKTEEYSHWMRQKLIFSAALIHNPKYLIIDEPMVWLDPQSNKIVKELIKELTHNYWVNIILTTHQLNIAADICDRIWIIHEWSLKSLFNHKSEFETKLESEFINITWWYNQEHIQEVLSFY